MKKHLPICLILTLAFFYANVSNGQAVSSVTQISVDVGSLGGSNNGTINDFGTATAMTSTASGSAILNAPVVNSSVGTITINGSANISAEDPGQGGAIDIDFDVAVMCEYSYVWTATVDQNDASSIPSSYGLSAGTSSSTAFLPIPGTSPISLSGTIANGSTQSFGFISLLSDFGGDGIDVDFSYELVLTPINLANCSLCPATITTGPTIDIIDNTCEGDPGSITYGPCPADTDIEYSTDGIIWSTTAVVYDEDNSIDVFARCTCDAVVGPTIQRTTNPASACVPVPTMGEWGLMCLGLILLILGVVTIKQRKLVLS